MNLCKVEPGSSPTPYHVLELLSEKTTELWVLEQAASADVSLRTLDIRVQEIRPMSLR